MGWLDRSKASEQAGQQITPTRFLSARLGSRRTAVEGRAAILSNARGGENQAISETPVQALWLPDLARGTEDSLMKHLPLAVASLLILSLCLATRPVAASSLEAQASAFDTHTGAGQSASTSDSTPLAVSFNNPGALSSERAFGSAQAGFGVLSTLASATASTVIVDPALRMNDPNPASARGFGTADFTDTITIHATPGSFVDVMIGASVHGVVDSLGYNLSYWCSPGHIGSFENTEPFVTLFVAGFRSQISQTLGNGVCPRASDRSSFTRGMALPAEIPFSFEMRLTTAAGASPYFGQGVLDFSNNQPLVMTNADASNTGFFFFQIVTPGATYTSQSGTVYLTGPPTAAVPEPMALSLLGAGLIAFAALSPRRRRG